MSQDYSVELREDVAVLSGIMRLHSAEAYDEALAPLRKAIGVASGTYSIDVSAVVFLNSSGIRGLAGLVIAAREGNKAILLLGSTASAWQVRTLPAFQALHPMLEVRFV
jgi:hypothetical protein